MLVEREKKGPIQGLTNRAKGAPSGTRQYAAGARLNRHLTAATERIHLVLLPWRSSSVKARVSDPCSRPRRSDRGGANGIRPEHPVVSAQRGGTIRGFRRRRLSRMAVRSSV